MVEGGDKDSFRPATVPTPAHRRLDGQMPRANIDENIVLHGDSRRASSYEAVLGRASVPLLHADPPYCLLVRRNKRGQAREPKRAKINHAAVSRFEDVSAYRAFTRTWLLPAAARLTDDGHAIIWTNLLGRPPIREVAAEAGLAFHGEFQWAKLGKQGNAGEKLARLYEVALIFGRTPAPALRPGDACPPRFFISGFDVEGEAGRWEHHPNHKPFSVLEPLLRGYSQPGDRVLEPFSGSGSTAAACVQLGRKVSAIELRETWAKVSRERLRATEGGGRGEGEGQGEGQGDGAHTEADR
jgi:site-specific DNA-methyltransferase (adenine-specific)